MDRESEGRAAAFTQLVGGSLDRAYALATVILQDREEAEEATHDAALQAWQRWSSLRDTSRFEAWFGRILVNACRDRLRRRRRTAPIVSGPLRSPDPDPFARMGEIEELREAIGDLSADHRTVIALRYLADLSLEEIAERLGVPLGTVKSRLHHALNALRASYAAVGRAVGSPTDE